MMIRTMAVLLVLFSCDEMRSQQTHSAYSGVFVAEAVSNLNRMDRAFHSVTDNDSDSIYESRWEDFQNSLASLRAKASRKREKKFLKLLDAGSTVIGWMHMMSGGSKNPYEFQRYTSVVMQCSYEARLRVEPDTASGKSSKDFKPGQCLEQYEALVRSVENQQTTKVN